MRLSNDFLPFVSRGAAALALIVLVLGIQSYGNSLVSQKTGCSTVAVPVCGVNGVTYTNSCEASAAGARLLYDSACPQPSHMTDAQRTFLFWLLHKRQEMSLPAVAIRLNGTMPGSCASCTTYTFVWGSPQVTARIVVDGSKIIEAKDSAGVDYEAPLEKNKPK